MALLRNLLQIAAAAHMLFIGAGSPELFGRTAMEEVTEIRDLSGYFDRAVHLKWKAFRDADDARYVVLTLPRFLARLPYGHDTNPVRAFKSS